MFIEKYFCLKISFYNIAWLQTLKNVPTLIVTNTLEFIITVLLRCLIRVFSFKYLLNTSDIYATCNDMFNMNVLFTCDLAIFPFLCYLMLVLTMSKMQ